MPGADVITVVSGLPRSGTSLMMGMLGAAGVPLLCDERRPADEDNPRGYFEYEPVKASARDCGWVRGAAGHAVKVVHALLAHLPTDQRYRVILMRRDLREVMASQRRMLTRHGEAVDQDEDALARLFARQLDEARDLVRSRSEMTLLEVDYSRLVAVPDRVAEGVAAFIGVAHAGPAMQAVVDPALHRNRA